MTHTFKIYSINIFKWQLIPVDLSFPFSYFSKYFFISPLISSLTYCLFSSMFHFHIWWICQLYSCAWRLVLYNCDQSDVWYDCNLFKFINTIFCLTYYLFKKNVPFVLEKNVYLVSLGQMLYICLSPAGLMCQVWPMFLYGFSAWIIYPLI